MTLPADTAPDPGPVPEHDPEDVVPTRDERLAALQRRAESAQDAAGWADPETKDGRADVTGGVVELGRVIRELLAMLRADARR